MTVTGFLLARIAEDEAVAPVPPSVAELLMAFAPGRVLAECAAKRLIVECFGVAEADGIHADGWIMAKAAVYAVAAVYADHPDYRDEWRP